MTLPLLLRRPSRGAHPASSRRLRSRIAAATTAAICALALALAGAAPAQARVVEPDRDRLPIVAGTRLQGPNSDCTAGAVLVPRSFFSRITNYARNTRYVVTAAHCFEQGAPVKVGGVLAGIVVWKSATSDLEMIKVPPRQDAASLSCVAHHPKNPAFCTPFTSYTPMANGQVFLYAGGRLVRKDVPGTGVPSGDDHFCTSGAIGGTKCVWHPASIPPHTPVRYQHLVAADASEATNVDYGDSGCAVVEYDGTLLGVQSSRQRGGTNMVYTPIQQVLRELPAYQLAP